MIRAANPVSASSNRRPNAAKEAAAKAAKSVLRTSSVFGYAVCGPFFSSRRLDRLVERLQPIATWWNIATDRRKTYD